MLISSESIKIGHPDAVADSIAANIISSVIDKEYQLGMTIDTMPHCGIEVLISKGFCIIGGEMSTRVWIDIEKIVRKTVINIGYNDNCLGLDGSSMGILNAIIPQSPDINIGSRAELGKYKEIGAGDQGIIYGYACNETPELLPLTFVLVNKMMRAFENTNLPFFAPDGKGQVVIEYDNITRKPKKLLKILMSNAIDYRFTGKLKRNDIEREAKKIILKCMDKWIISSTQFFFNPTGEWRSIYSCSAADSGITGRKLVVQFYGGYPGAQVGGGAVINKSPEKVDCSAAFGARYAAKNIVASGIAEKCSIQISYAIGIAKPMSIYIDTFGTGKISDSKIAKLVLNIFDFTPKGMIKNFNLLNSNLYKKITKTLFMDDYPWEKTDKIKEIIMEAKL